MRKMERFDAARSRLESQYEDARYDADTGLDKKGLEAEFQKHCIENPDEPHILTKAFLFHLLCTKARIAVDSEDYFVDKLEHHDLLRNLRYKWWRTAEDREFRGASGLSPEITAQLDTSHTCPDWLNLLNYGAAGLRDRAASRSDYFHKAVFMVYSGFVALLERFNEIIPSPSLQSLIKGPPQTFHEALQLAYLYNELQEMEGESVRSMGRFDHLYNSFYINDLKAKRLNREQAKEILKYFWIKFYAKSKGKGYGKPFTFGPEVNELSYLSIETYREMNAVDPKFHIRLSENTPRDFSKEVAGSIKSGCNNIVIVNDEKITGMLRKNGKMAKDARDYVLIGCYEPAVMGKELNCSGASRLNLAGAVVTTLARGHFLSFGQLMKSYLKTLDEEFTRTADTVRIWEKLWPEISPSPLLSGTMDSCIEKGLDVSESGAQYNTTGCCCVGLAHAVDSLAVIRHLVFDKKYCSLADIKKAMANNWQGFEMLRMTARSKLVPKWGNNDQQVDSIAVKITDFLGKRINHEPNARGGVFQAALYCIIDDAKSIGKKTGALPDGRLSGEHLTMNTGASPGMERNGVTSLINSVTKIDLSLFSNGTVLDIMLHPSFVDGAKGSETIYAIVRSFFTQGGIAIQFNIVDVETLLDAQAHPENYMDLQVRVCGWNVRFVDLLPEEQEIFITKAREGI